MGVQDGTGQAVKLGHDENNPGPAGGQGLTEPGAVLVGAGKSVINPNSFKLNPEVGQGIALGSEVLRRGGVPGIADQNFGQDKLCVT